MSDSLCSLLRCIVTPLPIAKIMAPVTLVMELVNVTLTSIKLIALVSLWMKVTLSMDATTPGQRAGPLFSQILYQNI